MGWMESLFVIAGSSMDAFSEMVSWGSLLQKINRKQLILFSIIEAIFQLAALTVGFFTVDFICRKDPASNETLIGKVFAVTVFFYMGFRLMEKRVRNKYIMEHLITRTEWKKMFRLIAAVNINMILIGIAFRLLNEDLASVAIMSLLFSVACIVAGTYTGYRLGFEQNKKAYTFGTALLWIAGVDVLIRLLWY